MKPIIATMPLALLALVAGCGTAGRLADVGRAPRFAPEEEMVTPDLEASIARASADQRAGTTSPPPASASLFRTGAGAFFRDQRAARQGDILTIRIAINDRASFDNSTARTRGGSENAGIGALLGLERPLSKLLPGNAATDPLVDLSSDSQSSGSGTTARQETLNMTMAAVVTGVLPNGNMLVRGRQQVRVNFELRELTLSGMIRPEDIARDNSIRHTQIAEAKISYGGRGQLTNAQQARWGQQIYDALFPF
jgi:flagellar L-ring protein FlgH